MRSKLFLTAILISFVGMATAKDNPPDSQALIPAHLNEEELQAYTSKNSTTAIRFTWKKSDGDDMVFRITRDNSGKGRLTVKKFSSEKKAILFEENQNISKSQIENIIRLKNASSFWKRPTHLRESGFDGALWIMEVAENGRYHYTERWSPLPPYYSKILDAQTNELIIKPGTPPEEQSKHSDEVALDMLCILVMLSFSEFDEQLY